MFLFEEAVSDYLVIRRRIMEQTPAVADTQQVSQTPLLSERTSTGAQQKSKGSQPSWGIVHTLGVIGLPIAMVVLGLYIPLQYRLQTWVVILFLLVVLTGLIGHGITRHWYGILIDERQKMSLSRFQMTLWTLIVLSAFFSIVLINMRGNIGPLEALAKITIPAELWVLLGISTASFGAANLILNNKLNNNSDAVAVNADPGNARFSDMFLGDDALNKDSVDLSKVQMFYFTIILVFGYAAALGGVFLYKSDLQFPAIADGFLALLGISHAGYLSYKAVPRNPG